MQTVLVVDDSRQIRGAIKDFLLYWQPDLHVLEAEDGEEGVKMASAYHPDVILLDMRMPKLNGAAAINVLRQTDDTTDIPVIGITADVGYNAAIKLMAESKCQAFLQKPFDAADLFSLINAIGSALK